MSSYSSFPRPELIDYCLEHGLSDISAKFYPLTGDIVVSAFDPVTSSSVSITGNFSSFTYRFDFFLVLDGSPVLASSSLYSIEPDSLDS